MLELYFYASSKLLTDGDIMSMSNSLEIRFPFLDTDLIKKVLHSRPKKEKSYSQNFKKANLSDKIANFPFHLMSNQKKGFTLPLDIWMKNNGKDHLDKTDSVLVDILNLDRDGLSQIHKKSLANIGSNEWIRSWQLFTLGKWIEINI